VGGTNPYSIVSVIFYNGGAPAAQNLYGDFWIDEFSITAQARASTPHPPPTCCRIARVV
jgi:hypothetical protein